MTVDRSFQNLGRPDDPRRVELVNEFYRPAGAAARAIRIETPEAGPLLVGLNDQGETLWAIPWAYISQVTPPSGETGAWNVRVEQSPTSAPTLDTRGPG